MGGDKDTGGRPKTIKDRAADVFRAGSRRDGSGSVGVESIFNVAAVCMAFVSFLATAGGLSEFVFVDHPLRALLVSFALQSILLTLSLQLPVYLRMARAAGAGKPRGGGAEPSRRRLSGGLVSFALICVFVASLLGSALFDFTFLANTAYSWADEGKRCFQLYLEGEYDDILGESEAVAKVSADGARDGLLAEMEEVSSLIQGSGGADEGTLGDLDTLSSSEDDSKFKALVDRAKGLLESYSEEEASQLVEAIQDYENQAVSDAEYYGGLAEDASAEAETFTSESTSWRLDDSDSSSYATQAAEASEKANEYRQMAADAARHANDASALESLVGGLVSSAESRIESALAELGSDLVSMSGGGSVEESGEVESEGSEESSAEETTDAIEANVKAIAEALLELDSAETGADGQGDDALSVAVNLRDAAYDYSAAVVAQNALRSAEKDSGEAPADYGSEDFDARWSEFWSERLETVSSALRQLPAQSQDGSAEVDGQAAALLDRIGMLQHDYLGDLNALEKAVVYLSFPYNTLAVLTLFLALYFDLAPLGIGIFLYTRKGVVASIAGPKKSLKVQGQGGDAGRNPGGNAPTDGEENRVK